jgi:hypothetical protein
MKIREFINGLTEAKANLNPFEAFHTFLNSIDTSIAGRDEYGDLRWHIESSAETNAQDTLSEQGFKSNNPHEYENALYGLALENAKFILDDWTSYYPQLRLDR